MKKKRVAILGSTGSIGNSTLKVVDLYPDLFEVSAITAFSNETLLREQQAKYKPRHVYLGQDEHALCDIAASDDVDVVVLAIRGAAALKPFLSAIRHKKMIAPANKEALVIAGQILMREAKAHGAVIIPVDSEQSAIFQCLDGQQCPIRRVHLTASGGPLLNMPVERFGDLKVEDILRHPRWKMGQKITVDSATLMNKGFEFIEAMRLFDLTPEQISVVVHPEAIIHSMVEFEDGSILAQLGITDMCLPIQYALTYPKRLATGLEPLDFVRLKSLNFQAPDYQKFPSLSLAMNVAVDGGSAPCVLNAADEEAVEAFLSGAIGFVDIYDVVEKTISVHQRQDDLSLDEIQHVDAWARQKAREIIGTLCRS